MKENEVIESLALKPKRKSLKTPEPVRQAIRLRSVQKSHIAVRRFSVQDVHKVEYRLKDGSSVFTKFIELPPIESKRLPDAQSYLQSETATHFTVAHHSSLFVQRDLDIVLYYDDEGKVLHVQEYGNSYI